MEVTASYSTSLLDSAHIRWGGYDSPDIIPVILDGFAGDLLISMSQESDSSQLQSFTVVANTVCHTANQCADSPVVLIPGKANFIYSNRSTYFNSSPVFPESLNASINNYLQVFFAAALYDAGVWTPNSIFVSPDSFVNTTLYPNDAVASAVAFNFISYQEYYPFVGKYSFPWPESSATQAMRAGFFNSYVPQLSSAVISMTYACHGQQLKPPLTLVICMSNRYRFILYLEFINLTCQKKIAILVANLSMFATFWAAFSFGATIAARSKASHTIVSHDRLTLLLLWSEKCDCFTNRIDGNNEYHICSK